MKGDAQPLIKFFDGSDKRFIIPLYQRNYDWKEPVRSVTVRAINLVSAKEPEQICLFSDPIRREKEEKLFLAIEEIRRRFGKGLSIQRP